MSCKRPRIFHYNKNLTGLLYPCQQISPLFAYNGVRTELLPMLSESRASGAMDNASDYGSEDSRFDSWLARTALQLLNHLFLISNFTPVQTVYQSKCTSIKSRKVSHQLSTCAKRCGRRNPGSNTGHGSWVKLLFCCSFELLHLLASSYCSLAIKSLVPHFQLYSCTNCLSK